jgi:DUF917 family protein
MVFVELLICRYGSAEGRYVFLGVFENVKICETVKKFWNENASRSTRVGAGG